MAGIIPENISRKLASQQTGTLGTPRVSAGDVTRSIAGSTASVFQEKEQARAKKLEKGRESDIASRAILQGSSFKQKLADARDASKTQEEYNQKSKEIFDQHSADIEDGEVLNSFKVDGADILDKSRELARRHFKDVKRKTTSAGMDAVVADSENDAYDLGRSLGGETNIEDFVEDSMFFTDILAGMQGRTEVLLGELDPEKAQIAQQENTVGVINQMVNGLLDSGNPESVNTFLDLLLSGPAGEIPGINADQIQELRDYAADKTEAREVRRKKQQVRDKEATEQDIVTAMREGEVTESEWKDFADTGLLTTDEINAFKRNQNSTKKRFIGDNPSTQRDLRNEFDNISDALRRSKVLEDIEAKEFELSDEEKKQKKDFEITMLGKVSTFRQSVLEAEEQGTISQTQAAKYLDRITPKFNESIGELFDTINVKHDVIRSRAGFFTSLGRLITGEEQKFDEEMVFGVPTLDDPIQVLEAKERLAEEIMTNIDVVENAKQRRLSVFEANAVAVQTAQEFMFKVNPEYSRYEIGGVYKLNGRQYKVIGRSPDQSPIFDDDLNAAIKGSNFELELSSQDFREQK